MFLYIPEILIYRRICRIPQDDVTDYYIWNFIRFCYISKFHHIVFHTCVNYNEIIKPIPRLQYRHKIKTTTKHSIRNKLFNFQSIRIIKCFIINDLNIFIVISLFGDKDPGALGFCYFLFRSSGISYGCCPMDWRMGIFSCPVWSFLYTNRPENKKKKNC